jgi:hypothetical protein
MSERGEIKRDGAKAIKNSGRGWKEKGDARWQDFIVDYKEYEKGFRITRDNWGKICTDTMKTDLSASPVLKLILGEQPNVIRLAVLEWSKLELIYEYIEMIEDQVADLHNTLYGDEDGD